MVTVVDRKRRQAALSAAAAVLAACVAGCSSDNPDARFLDELHNAGIPTQTVPTGRRTGVTAEMGNQICAELDGGLSARGAADRVAAVQLDEPQHFSPAQADTIVLWSVKVLCPGYSALLPTPPPAWTSG